jgi:hypothetical protein
MGFEIPANSPRPEPDTPYLANSKRATMPKGLLQKKQPQFRGLAPLAAGAATSAGRSFSMTSYFERNEVLNRVVMDVFGWGGPGIIFARNLYERVERSMDIGAWLVAGVLIPLGLDRVVNRQYTAYLKKKFPRQFAHQKGRAQPMGLNFEALGPRGRVAVKSLKDHGLKSLTPKLARHIFRCKTFYILLPDMILMATKGQGYYWGKNFLTEKLTGKKGFVGEFNYAQDDYLKKRAAEFEATKKKRMLASLLIGYGSAIALPLLIAASVRNPKGPFGFFKKVVPAFNYSDTIYMSKWVLTWHTFFNWNITSMLSSRDKHELRENFVRTSIVLGLVAIGDDFINGAIAKRLNRYAIKKYKTPILAKEKGLFNMPKLMRVDDVIRKYGKKSPAYKLVCANFWIGILGVCAAINSILPVLNNYYTKQKVLREQAQGA